VRGVRAPGPRSKDDLGEAVGAAVVLGVAKLAGA